MEKAKVYFTDMRAYPGKENLLQKLERLMVKAGIDKIDFKNKFVAIKIHFGEPGNLAYLRPNYAKVVADVLTYSPCLKAGDSWIQTIFAY